MAKKIKVGDRVIRSMGVAVVEEIFGPNAVILFVDGSKSRVHINELTRLPSIGDTVRFKNPGKDREGNLHETAVITDISDTGDCYQVKDGNWSGTWFMQDAFDVIDDEVVVEDKCVCDKFALFNLGCRCGKFQREMKEKSCSN